MLIQCRVPTQSSNPAQPAPTEQNLSTDERGITVVDDDKFLYGIHVPTGQLLWTQKLWGG